MQPNSVARPWNPEPLEDELHLRPVAHDAQG